MWIVLGNTEERFLFLLMLLMRWMTLTKCKESSNSNDDDMQMATGWPLPSAQNHHHHRHHHHYHHHHHPSWETEGKCPNDSPLSNLFHKREDKVFLSLISSCMILIFVPITAPVSPIVWSFSPKAVCDPRRIWSFRLFCSKPLLHIELCVNPPLFRPAAKWQGFAKTPQTSSSSEDDLHKIYKVADFLSHCQLCPIVGAL